MGEKKQDDLPSPPAREAGKWLDLSGLKREGSTPPSPPAKDFGSYRGSARGGFSPPPYAELHAASAFSFLDGASLPEDLVERAAALGLPAVALVDANGVYAAPRFFQAAKSPSSARRPTSRATLAGWRRGTATQAPFISRRRLLPPP